MKVTYIEHSGFYIELKQHNLLFDYFQGHIPNCENKEKPILVFVSHKHHDHFNLEIFNLACEHPNIQFFISKDARMNTEYMKRKNIPKEAFDKIRYVGKNEIIKYEDIQIETLTSTDQGVAFVVSCENKEIYHAGDLNWWSWLGETEEQHKSMEKRYVTEINKLKNKPLDIAFVPLDPRQETLYWKGMDYFMRTVSTEYVFPMHSWGDYSIITKFLQREESASYRKYIIPIAKNGQEFIIESKRERKM